MQRLSSIFRRAVLSSFSILFTKSPSPCGFHSKPSFTTFSLRKNGGNLHPVAIPGNFLKWALLGSFRTSRFATGFAPLEPKPIDSIMDVERAKSKSTEELVSIWDDYHLGRGHIGLSMKAKLYHLLEQRATDCRYFVIPLWRGSGYTTMFAQETKDLVLIRGDVVFTSKLTDEEAKWLLETVQSFYLNDTRYKLVERFNKETRDFEFKDVLRALDMPVL